MVAHLPRGRVGTVHGAVPSPASLVPPPATSSQERMPTEVSLHNESRLLLRGRRFGLGGVAGGFGDAAAFAIGTELLVGDDADEDH